MQRLMHQCALQTNRFLKLFVVFMFTSIICREFYSLFSSEEMYAFFDKRGHHRAQLIDRPATLQTSQKELCDFLVRSALQRSDQPGTLNARAHEAKRNVEKISTPKRSIKITGHFNRTSANAIYCITCTLFIGKRRRRLGDRFREHLRHAEEHAKDASKPVARHFNLPNIYTVQ